MRRRCLLFAAALVCLLAAPSLAVAGIDFEVTDVHVVFGGPYIYIEAELTVAASGYHDGYLVDVEYEVDGSVVGTVQVDLGAIDHVGVPSPRCVDSVSPCEGYCPPVVIDGETVTAAGCWDWLADPDCCCVYLVVSTPSDPVEYTGQSTATATVDAGDAVVETDESNNSMTVTVPPPNIDLSIAGCDVTWDGNEFVVEAQVQASVQGEHNGFYTDVSFYFDGEFHGSVVYDADAFGPNPAIRCEDTYPACNGLCAPTTINGQLVSGSCSSWFLEDACGCIYVVAKFTEPVPHSGEENCTIVVDDSGSVAEADEANNSYECAIAGTAVSSGTWTTIKALYR